MEALEKQIRIVKRMNIPKVDIRKYDKIAVCGMGGSGISGYILRDLYDDKPVFVFQGYELPKFVDKKTLVFCISYSGNTAETISMYNHAKKRGCKVVVISQ